MVCKVQNLTESTCRIVIGFKQCGPEHKADAQADLEEPESNKSSVGHVGNSRARLILFDDPSIRLVVVKRIANDHPEPLVDDGENREQEGKRPDDKVEEERPLAQESMEFGLWIRVVVGEILGIIPKGLLTPEHIGDAMNLL